MQQSVSSISHYFTGALRQSIMSRALCSQHLLQTSIIASSLWLIQENLKGTCLFEENHCNPAPLKVLLYKHSACVFHVETTWKRMLPRRFNVECTWRVCRVIYSTKPVAIIFVCTHPHSFMVNVLIWQIHNSNCSYSLSIVNFFRRAVAATHSFKFTIFFQNRIFFWR